MTPPNDGRRIPDWIRFQIPGGKNAARLRGVIKKAGLHTVCMEARCPNVGECMGCGTATFLILGDTCTRNCRYCSVTQGTPRPPEPDEPRRVGHAVQTLGLTYAVITSVTRDDLPDGGAGIFADTIKQLRARIRGVKVEVLVPDFGGSRSALERVLAAEPNVLNHNLETVSRLYPVVRPEARYSRSLKLLETAARTAPAIPTKSGLMLGLGETDAEVEKALSDLLTVDCKMLTLGQYLQPTRDHLPVESYIEPEHFDRWKQRALEAGFEQVASGPLVRSSYQAHALYAEKESA